MDDVAEAAAVIVTQGATASVARSRIAASVTHWERVK